jgi:hypothetical protein
VALADGDIVAVRGEFGPGARTGARFEGRLAVPPSVARALAARGDSGPSAALRVVDRRSLVLRVVGAPSITAAPAATPTTHEQFVAAVDNRGALGQDDSRLLAHVSTVGEYWTGESNGAIAGVTVPPTVTHYDTALPTTDCGLGSDFFGVVQEAEAEFPGFSFGGGDQLVVFVPRRATAGRSSAREPWGPASPAAVRSSSRPGPRSRAPMPTRPVTTTASSTPTLASPARRWSTTAPTT